MESQHWDAHTIPPHLTEELFPGLSYEEALEDQQALYEAFKVMGGENTSSAADFSSTSRILDAGQESNDHHHNHHQAISTSWEEYILPESLDVNSQLALDEAMARLLQNLEDDDNASIPEHAAHSCSTTSEDAFENATADAASEASENAASEASASSSAEENTEDNQDDVDPDDMTYEELQNLGEAIGSENKGLSEDDISSLPSFKYRSGYISTTSNLLEECVICCSCYEHKQYVTFLPCAHQYHSDCINKWLRLSKSCPICQVEVDASN